MVERRPARPALNSPRPQSTEPFAPARARHWDKMASSGANQISHAKPSGDLFGHPRGLTFLFATEMWERFSYYGMRALLVLYMTKYLLSPGRAEGVIGLDGLRTLLESMFGPLGVQPFASLIYGLYTGLVYLTPVIGGLIADRLLRPRRN